MGCAHNQHPALKPVRRCSSFLCVLAVVLTLSILVGCASCTWNLDLVDYAPLPASDWVLSTPEAKGLDPMLVAELYFNAAKLETLYRLLIIK